MVATGDKVGVCRRRPRGPRGRIPHDRTLRRGLRRSCLRSAAERTAFLDRFFAVCPENLIGGRSSIRFLDWIPVLHDRGLRLKLGDSPCTSSQIARGTRGQDEPPMLRRAGTRRRPVPRWRPTDEVRAHLDELEEISDQWLRTKGLGERQARLSIATTAHAFPCGRRRDCGNPPSHRRLRQSAEGPATARAVCDLMRHRAMARR